MMNKETKNWRENLYSTIYCSKYIFQGVCNVSPYHMPTEFDNKERIIKNHHNEEIASYTSCFSQFDLAFSLASRKLCHQQHSLNIIFSLSDMIHAMGRADGGNTRRLVLDSMKKNCNNHVCLYMNGKTKFEGRTLKKLIEKTHNNFITHINEDYFSLIYAEDEICEINFDKFLSLPLGLQTWLYGFFCSDPTANSIDIDRLHDVSGSNFKSAYDFKKAVKAALYALEHRNIIGWRHGVTRDGLVFWEIKDLT